MKVLFITFLLALFAVCAVAVVPQRSVIVTYPDPNTPSYILNQAKKAIEDAGGIITHEYKVIKGFAAQAPSKVLDSVQEWGAKYNAFIEDDQIVSAYGSS